jgi:2-(1,2-epoxy-1,2-dihydrophenyl)acetyl-CoA isomerase
MLRLSMSAVRVERAGAVATVTLDRPTRRNALDVPSMQELRGHLQSASLDPSVRAVVLTGAGGSFCAGGDIAAMNEHRERGELPRFFHELTGEQELLVREVVGMRKPVVAALPGVAAGGGLSLALAADWRIAAEEAVLVPAFSGLGAVPDGGLTYFLPHYLGLGLAQELLFSNAKVPAARAHELGLVHEVVPGPALAARTAERARELAEGPTFAWGWTKHLLARAFSGTLEGQLMLERRGAVEAAERPDLAEGVRAFAEKRRPTFRGAPPG